MHNMNGVKQGEPMRFYVALDGSDRAAGTADAPWRTLARARRAVRELKKQSELAMPVEVIVGGGTWFLKQPLAFGPADSGTAECPVTWRAAPGARVVISGGRRIEGWREDELNGRRAWVADVADVKAGGWTFRQLFANGRRAPRTRLPKTGLYRIERVLDYKPGQYSWRCPMKRFGYAEGDIDRWRNLRDVEVVALTRWIESRLPLARVDTKRRIISFDRLTRHALFDERDKTLGTEYWVENVFEALDEPGQWYLDRPKGRLYYLPLDGERIEDSEIIAPRLPQVLRIVGMRARKAAHLHFEGITFAHTEWDLPAGWPGSNQASHEVPGAVYLEQAQGCAITGGAVEHVGNYAVEVGAGCMDTEISRNRIEDLGAGGVKVGHNSARTTVADNVIAHGGRLFMSAVGVWVGHSPGNKIIHNHIYDLYYSGISVGWVWGYAASKAVGNIVEYNHVHDIGHGLLSDMGGVYTLGVSPGTRIRFNVFHDVNCRGYGGWGIYTDEGSTDILIEKNLSYRCNSAPFHQHYGCENRIVNNIWAFGKNNQIERSRIEGHDSFIFRRNIIYYTDGELLGRKWDPPAAQIDYNLYWNAAGRPVTIAGKSFSEWQSTGQDAHSLIADPLFIDPTAGDFRLRRGSPALKLGFEPFDLSSVGPRKQARQMVEDHPRGG